MKTVLYNAKIYVEKNHFAEALLIEDGVIEMVGSNEDVLMEAEGAKLIDCQKKTVLPGFNDSHMHLYNLALSYARVNLDGVRSAEEMVKRSRDFVKANPNLVEKGMLGRGWVESLFENPDRLPTRWDLDKISTEFPIVLSRVCGHMAVCNSLCLEKMGIKKGSKQIDGGKYYTDENGEPNGLISENLIYSATALVPALSKEDSKKLLLMAMDDCVKSGLTSVQSNDIDDFEEDKDLFEAIQELYEEGVSPLRYRFQCRFSSYESLEKTLTNKQYRLKIQDPWLTLGPIKMFKDGSLGAHTALMKEEYSDDPGNIGIDVTTLDEQRKWVELANRYKIPVVTHAIGDRAVEETMISFKENGREKNACRNGIIHTQITSHKLLDEISDNRILLYYQPIFLEYDISIIEDRVGKQRAKESYAFRYFKGHKSFGTDCPVESYKPFLNLHCAINRTDYHDLPEGGFYPEECMDISEAIDCYTYESAYAEFMEKRKGRLNVGYDADLIVCDKDIFTVDKKEIKNIHPVLTMVDGYIVYEE